VYPTARNTTRLSPPEELSPRLNPTPDAPSTAEQSERPTRRERARAATIDEIKETALLEFKMLDESSKLTMELPQRIPKGKDEEILKQFASRVPEGDEILFEKVTEKDTGREYRIPYLVKKRVMLAGDVLSDARVSIGQFNEPYVSVSFDAKGAREFDRITAENVKKRMAIVLDNTIYSAPVIQERISGGRAQITGSFTMQEANDLAIVLRAGALPAPLKIIQDLTVGPSLGRDSIEKGLRATVIAGGLVVLFMMVYYRLSGVIADFALALNLICLIGALAGLNATLTLPGIAGIILTIGMGVDSNVLIYERVREERKGGRTPLSAINVSTCVTCTHFNRPPIRRAPC
jgi:preprotein translocase subunit SecD